MWFPYTNAMFLEVFSNSIVVLCNLNHLWQIALDLTFPRCFLFFKSQCYHRGTEVRVLQRSKCTKTGGSRWYHQLFKTWYNLLEWSHHSTEFVPSDKQRDSETFQETKAHRNYAYYSRSFVQVCIFLFMLTIESLIQIDRDKFYAAHLPGGLISERFKLYPSKPFFSVISSVRKYFILYYTEHWFWNILWCLLSYVKRKLTPYSCTLIECKRFPRNSWELLRNFFFWEPLLIEIGYRFLCFLL